jgi:hypothetical protein
MSDIVKRLRVPDEEWMPKGTRVILMYNNTLYEPDNFSLWYGSAIKLEAADEIERLRARVEVLERVREAAQAWREDMTMPTDHARSGAIGRRLINALAEIKP